MLVLLLYLLVNSYSWRWIVLASMLGEFYESNFSESHKFYLYILQKESCANQSLTEL